MVWLVSVMCCGVVRYVCFHGYCVRSMVGPPAGVCELRTSKPILVSRGVYCDCVYCSIVHRSMYSRAQWLAVVNIYIYIYIYMYVCMYVCIC